MYSNVPYLEKVLPFYTFETSPLFPHYRSPQWDQNSRGVNTLPSSSSGGCSSGFHDNCLSSLLSFVVRTKITLLSTGLSAPGRKCAFSTSRDPSQHAPNGALVSTNWGEHIDYLRATTVPGVIRINTGGEECRIID